MAINEVIKHIDEYLALLRRARNILCGDEQKTSVEQTESSKRSARPVSKKPVIPRSSSLVRTSSTRRKPVTGRVSSKDPASSIVKAQAPLPGALSTDRTTAPSSDLSNSSSVVVKRLPPRHRMNANRHTAYRGIKAGTQDSVKPSLLPSGMGSRIVVISAEQARLEREQSTKPTVPRPRPLGSRPTGRSAFEALFSR